MKKNNLKIPIRVLERFSQYYHILTDETYVWGKAHISSFELANILGIEDTQIRNDFMHLDIKGKPKVGYSIEELKFKLSEILGFRCIKDSVLVGVGYLGKALVNFDGFEEYGLRISFLFDIDKEKINTKVNNKLIYHIEKLPNIVKKNNIKIGIITTPRNEAQKVADLLVNSGIISIWNFAPTTLKVPDNVFVQNENIADSLAFISHYCYFYEKDSVCKT
jgi:redox-sensing transcriptional repressor